MLARSFSTENISFGGSISELYFGRPYLSRISLCLFSIAAFLLQTNKLRLNASWTIMVTSIGYLSSCCMDISAFWAAKFLSDLLILQNKIKMNNIVIGLVSEQSLTGRGIYVLFKIERSAFRQQQHIVITIIITTNAMLPMTIPITMFWSIPTILLRGVAGLVAWFITIDCIK